MADLRIADAPEIDESEVQGGLKIPTGGFGNKAINMNTVASWVVKDKDLPSKDYVDDKFNQGNQGLAGHVANKNNPHEVTKEQVGLGNVDNTADADKPISNATSAALNLKADKTQLQGLATTTQLDAKADKSTTYTKTEVDGVVDDLYQSLEDNFVANGAALPYDPQVTYNDGAIVVDNGVLKKVEGGTLVNAVDAESINVGDSTLDVFAQQTKKQTSVLTSNVDFVEKSIATTSQAQMYFTNKNPTFDPSALGYIGWKQGDNVSEFSLQKNVDDLMLVKYGWFAPVESPKTMVQASNFRDAQDNPIDPATTITGWGTSNPYFSESQIGFKFDLVFDGVGVISRHNGNAQGGAFKVTIPNIIEKVISAYAVPSSTQTIEIVNGLPRGQYTATFEYIGQDPNNPVTAPRGFFKYDLNNTVQQSSGYVISGEELIGSTSKTLCITNIIEFAIKAKPANTQFTSDWIPSHSQVLGATVTKNRKILIDGVNFGNDFSTISLNTVKRCNEILIIQNYTAYCTSDTEKTMPLWDGKLVHKFNMDGLTITNEATMLRDVEFGNGYMGMVSSRGSVTPSFETDSGVSGIITGTTDGWYPQYAKSCIFYNKETKRSVAVKVLSIIESANLNKEYAPQEITRLTDRTDGFGKIYWNLFNNGQVLKEGDKLKDTHQIFMSSNNYSL